MTVAGKQADEYINTLDRRQWAHTGVDWRERPYEDRLLGSHRANFPADKVYSETDVNPSQYDWIALDGASYTVKKSFGATTDLMISGHFTGRSIAVPGTRWNTGFWIAVWMPGMHYLERVTANPKPWGDIAGRGVVNEWESRYGEDAHTFYYANQITGLAAGNYPISIAIAFDATPGAFLRVHPQHDHWSMTVWEVLH